MHLPILNIALTLIGGLGIGSLLTTFLKDRFDRKHFKYKEKLNVYFGYLEALQNCVIDSNEENRQRVVYWHLRMRIIAPNSVDRLAAEFYHVKPGEEFTLLRDKIVAAMKLDLDRSI